MTHEWIEQLRGEAGTRGVSSNGGRRRATAELGPDVVAWATWAGRKMADHILATLPDWPGDRSEEEDEALHRAAEASTLDTLVALHSGDRNVLTQSIEPTENVVYYIRNGIPLDEVLRNVHSGEEFLTAALLDEIDKLESVPGGLTTVKEMMRDVSTCWSIFARHISVVYQREHEEWLQSREGARGEVVRRILDQRRVDAVEASAAMGYELDQAHVAMTLSLPEAEVESARAFDFAGTAERIAAAAGTAHPLIVRRGPSYADVWLGSPRTDPAGAIAKTGSWPSALRVAIGERGHGEDGFRLSYLQARAAHRLSRLARTAETVTAYADVELASLLVADLDRARSFVRKTLGPLGVASTRALELRRTLAQFIDNRGSVAVTAQAMFTHRNTVTYRLRQIDELLGPDRDTTIMRCALELADLLPHYMLTPEHPAGD